jgi:hypothetical protein
LRHGLRSWNGLDYDGSTVYLYTSDRQCLEINPNSGSIEIGFAIGDLLERTVDPSKVYLSRHIAGSQDNALYLADGATGWLRCNVNQSGASLSGEATPVWSPFANFTPTIGGIGAIASIETSAGVSQLLVGQTSTGVVLARNLNVFTDNGNPYIWSATIGSMLLATPGKLAETLAVVTELNNSGVNGYSTQCGVSVLCDEISGNFENLSRAVNDPPQLPTIQSVLSKRFYLSQGNLCPVLRHIQVQLNGVSAATQDELLALTVIGALVPEQAA